MKSLNIECSAEDLKKLLKQIPAKGNVDVTICNTGSGSGATLEITSTWDGGTIGKVINGKA